MSAIPPPPVGADPEPARVLSDNRTAVTALRESGVAGGPLTAPRERSFGALLGLVAATLLAATVGARFATRPKISPWSRLLRTAIVLSGAQMVLGRARKRGPRSAAQTGSAP